MKASDAVCVNTAPAPSVNGDVLQFRGSRRPFVTFGDVIRRVESALDAELPGPVGLFRISNGSRSGSGHCLYILHLEPEEHRSSSRPKEHQKYVKYFSDLQGNCKTNPEEAGRKLAGKVDHTR